MKRMLALEALASCALKRIVEAAWSMWRIIPCCVVTELSLLAEARDQAPTLCLLLSCSRLVVHLNTSRHHVAAALAPAYNLTTPYPLALHAWVRQSTSSLRCVCRPRDTYGTVQAYVSRPRPTHRTPSSHGLTALPLTLPLRQTPPFPISTKPRISQAKRQALHQAPQEPAEPVQIVTVSAAQPLPVLLGPSFLLTGRLQPGTKQRHSVPTLCSRSHRQLTLVSLDSLD